VSNAAARGPSRKLGVGGSGGHLGLGNAKLSRPREQRVFNIACERDAVHEEFFALKGSQQLIGQCDPESVPAAMGVTALPIDGWLVVQVGRACHDIRPGGLPPAG